MQWKAPGEDHHLEALRSDDRARAVVQWKAPGEDHHSSRQIVLSGLSSLSTTISGLINGTQYAIRIAAVDTSDPGNFLHKNGHKRYVETTGQPPA